MNTLLGSQFEASLRILLLFQAAHGALFTEERLVTLDFITIYSSDFGMTNSNLHGENKYRFGEYALRRKLVRSAIKRLVLDGLINVAQTIEGFKYTLNQNGIEFVASLDSDYADAYYETAVQVLNKTKGKSGIELSEMINRRALSIIEGG